MTREEAVKKLVDAKVLHPNIGGNYILLDALEALGLIKFDKPEISIHEAIYLARGSVIGSQVDQNHFIKYLKNLGYKIERI